MWLTVDGDISADRGVSTDQGGDRGVHSGQQGGDRGVSSCKLLSPPVNYASAPILQTPGAKCKEYLAQMQYSARVYKCIVLHYKCIKANIKARQMKYNLKSTVNHALFSNSCKY